VSEGSADGPVLIASNRGPVSFRLGDDGLVATDFSGEVAIVRYEGVPDRKGQVQGYRVWVKRKP